MMVYNLRIKRNRTCRLEKSTFLTLIISLTVGIFLVSCASSLQTTSQTTPQKSNTSEKNVISEVSTYLTALKKEDVAKYFCQNLTEYFNSFKYYKISSEIFNESDKQNRNSTSRITKQGNIYDIEYIGSAGRYVISFSNSKFYGSDEIYTFGSFTVLGNAIRRKVYDTFSAWVYKQEIALKANYNTHLFSLELNAAVEIENWYNSLSVSQ